MIKLLSASAIAILALSLGGCVAEARPDHHGRHRTNDVTIERNTYEYYDGYPYHHDIHKKGNHCPPGHAKKGWC